MSQEQRQSPSISQQHTPDHDPNPALDHITQAGVEGLTVLTNLVHTDNLDHFSMSMLTADHDYQSGPTALQSNQTCMAATGAPPVPDLIHLQTPTPTAASKDAKSLVRLSFAVIWHRNYGWQLALD